MIDTTVVEVVSDTLMENGKKYFVLDGYEFLLAKYIREDSHGIYYYEQNTDESLFYRFDLPIDTPYTVNFRFYNIGVRVFEGQTVILGETTGINEFHYDGLAVTYVVLSEKFGPMANLDLGDPPGWITLYRVLIGAVISNVKYGYIPTAVNEEKQLHLDFLLSQNFPNPFNPITTINYQLPETEYVTLKIYDVLGREIETLVNEEKSAGTYELTWNATNLPSGVYFYQLRAGSFIETKKMIYLK